jgi:hypothetical protein
MAVPDGQQRWPRKHEGRELVSASTRRGKSIAVQALRAQKPGDKMSGSC